MNLVLFVQKRHCVSIKMINHLTLLVEIFFLQYRRLTKKKKIQCLEDAQDCLMLKQKVRTVSCFVGLHIFCWINSENLEYICHILDCVWMRFSWNLRISSEKWLCFTVRFFFEPGEVINSPGLPTQASLFVTRLNLRIQCVYSGGEQNSSRLFMTF